MADDSDVITFNFPQGDQNEDAILAEPPKENESGEPVVMTNKSSHMCDRDFNLKLDERCESMLEMVDSRMSLLERYISEKLSVLDQKSLDHIHVDPTDRQRLMTPPLEFLRRSRHSSPHSNDHGGKIKMKPQLYDGTGDLDEYLAQFEILTEINDWNFSKKALYLAASLSGAALSVLSELSSSERTDFNLLVRTLKDRFGSEYRAEASN